MRKITLYLIEDFSEFSDPEKRKIHSQFVGYDINKVDVTEKHISSYTTPDFEEEVYILVNAYKKWNEPFGMHFISPIMAGVGENNKQSLNPSEMKSYYEQQNSGSDMIAKYKERFFEPHSNKVRTDAANGKIRIILFHALEGYYALNFDYVCKLLDIPPERLIYISGDTNIADRGYHVECHFFNYWERSSQRFVDDHPSIVKEPFQKQLDLIVNKTVRPYYNTVYNRQYRDHRLQLMGMLKRDNLLSSMIWSWGGLKKNDPNMKSLRELVKKNPEHNNTNFVDSYIWQLSNGQSQETKDAMKELLYLENIQNGKTSKEDLNINLVWTLNFDHIYNVYYQFICETWATSGETCFLSEKAYKPFMLSQPFIQWGDPGAIQSLRDSGYDTYDKWIDHSYDLISNKWDRLNSLNSTVKKLNTLSLSDHAEMLYEMRYEIENNYHNLMRATERNNLFGWK